MGFDITHYKATLEKPIKVDASTMPFITEEDFDSHYFDVDISYFEKSLQLIDVPQVESTLIFPLKEEDLKKVKDFLKDHDDTVFLLEKDLRQVSGRIEKYMEANNLVGRLWNTWETSSWIGCHIYHTEKRKGFYFEKVGDQRKGMNISFWNRFCSSETYCYTNQEDFEFALGCVDYCWSNDTKDDLDLRKRGFKEDFVDKYEAGKSWLNVSY